jgi:hypothetical protein
MMAGDQRARQIGETPRSSRPVNGLDEHDPLELWSEGDARASLEKDEYEDGEWENARSPSNRYGHCPTLVWSRGSRRWYGSSTCRLMDDQTGDVDTVCA